MCLILGNWFYLYDNNFLVLDVQSLPCDCVCIKWYKRAMLCHISVSVYEYLWWLTLVNIILFNYMCLIIKLNDSLNDLIT